MSSAPSGSLALQCIKFGDALEICDGIIFKFDSLKRSHDTRCSIFSNSSIILPRLRTCSYSSFPFLCALVQGVILVTVISMVLMVFFLNYIIRIYTPLPSLQFIHTQCKDLVNSFGPDIIQLIDDEIDPSVICKVKN